MVEVYTLIFKVMCKMYKNTKNIIYNNTILLKCMLLERKIIIMEGEKDG